MFHSRPDFAAITESIERQTSLGLDEDEVMLFKSKEKNKNKNFEYSAFARLSSRPTRSMRIS